jgi:hypothetical protein
VLELRLRTKVPATELDRKVGKILGPEDYNVFLTGPARVLLPSGRPLCVYLPGVLRDVVDSGRTYEVLHGLRTQTSNNRGIASGGPRFTVRHSDRSYARKVASSVVGAVDPMGQQKYCRLTAWTGAHLPEWQALQPLLQEVARQQALHVPDRAAAQRKVAESTDPAWVVPGTPFSTVTVNNTYPTGVHTDKGDLDEGFSTIACLRRGSYTGGHLVFPEYRVAADMQHGDLMLMDAHQWHGNTALVCACGREPNGCCPDCGAERISVVSYFRTKVASCGTPEEELRKADAQRARL